MSVVVDPATEMQDILQRRNELYGQRQALVNEIAGVEIRVETAQAALKDAQRQAAFDPAERKRLSKRHGEIEALGRQIEDLNGMVTGVDDAIRQCETAYRTADRRRIDAEIAALRGQGEADRAALDDAIQAVEDAYREFAATSSKLRVLRAGGLATHDLRIFDRPMQMIVPPNFK